MKKIKIIFSSYDDIKNPYYAGGGALAIHQIAKHLINNYEIVVLTGKYPGSKDETIDGVHYNRIGLGFLGAKADQLAFQICLPWYVITLKYDIWLESFTPPFSTSCLQLFTKKPVVGIVHMLSGEDMRRKYKLPFDWVEKIGLTFYKHFIVLSDTMKNKIRKINKHAEIGVIPNGVEQIHPVNKTKEYILFIGRIEVNQKGLDLLLTAYAKIAEKVALPLAIVGSGEKSEEKKLEELINLNKLSGKVLLLGRVKGEKKAEVYSKAACVIISSRFETFSMVALEAMANSVPLICFAIEGLSWVPNDIAKKVTCFDREKLAKAISDVVTNTSLSESMRKKGSMYVKPFTWDGITKSYDTYLKKVINI